jgi:hypothetical protein
MTTFGRAPTDASCAPDHAQKTESIIQVTVWKTIFCIRVPPTAQSIAPVPRTPHFHQSRETTAR